MHSKFYSDSAEWERFYLSLIKKYILNDSFWPEFMVLIFLKKDNRVVFTTTLDSNVHVTTSFRLICIYFYTFWCIFRNKRKN